jgi:signal-transduction protein with cAMP-binding, CBS, and nucleotidyltransferase domain
VDAFENMMGYFEHAAFKAGECIISKGESPTHIYIIQSGSVELRIADGATNLRKRESS